MAKITKFICLGLTPELFQRTRTEATLQDTSVNALIRAALNKHLDELNRLRHGTYADMMAGMVPWTAHEVLRQFFEEDR
jgi:hypothetical protein